MNGIRSDTLPVEIGVAGIKVRAFVDLSKTPIETFTDATGKYSFSNTDAPLGKLVRIEFDSLAIGDYNGPFGANSGTSVQFVTAPAIGINVGINYPSDYCQPTGIRFAVPCYVNGNTQTLKDADGNDVPIANQSADSPAIVGIAYSASGVAGPSNFPPDHLATAGEVGAVWALAYQRRSKKLFSAAVVKRHMSFGPLGSGGIYITDVTAGTTTNFVDVRTIGIDTGDDPHSGLFGDKSKASTDPGSMTAMGRQSIGGMDISEDDKTLYLINLKDRKLYSIFVNSPAQVPTAANVQSWAIPDPGCSNGDFRPWAVKVYRGKVYIGVVCSAETSQLQADLKATIYRFDPTAATPTFETVLAFPLDFRRGPADNTTDPNNSANDCTKYDHWLPWKDTWPTPCGLGPNPNFVMYPQPMVVDLAFDDDGSMVIGFLDRFGHMSGVANHDPQGNGSYDGFTGGDILRAYNNKGTFVLESNGKAGDRTGSGVGDLEGPGGGEFYGTDYWFFIDHFAHSEVTNGALTLIPGYNEVISSAFDPIENIYKAGGLKVFNNKNGKVNRNYVLYANTNGSFGKASGLGDSKALCDPAPVEIGNRVWYDDNRDGIQDAYEPGIDGLLLTLHDMEDGGKQLATQKTHDGGQYYFNNTTVPTGLQFGHKYEIRMDTAQLSLLSLSAPGARRAAPGGRVAASAAGARSGTFPKQSYTISPPNRSNFPGGDLRDSDALLTNTYAYIPLTTLNAGQNVFTYDLSVYSCPVLKQERDTIAVCPGAKVDSVVADAQYLSRVDSVRFVVFSSPQSGTAMYQNTGTVLKTIKPDAFNRAVLYNPAINTTNNTSAPLRQYVYAIIFPIPEDPNCRTSGETVVEIAPAVSATATGGALTCSVKSVTLTGQAIYGDGSKALNATYAWQGPNSFSSTQQNPVTNQPGIYTLIVSSTACPGNTTTVTAEVISNTVAPSVTTSVTPKTCPTCPATITANSDPNATYKWTGPNGYTATGPVQQVTATGTYTVTVTGVNGCTASADVIVTDFICPTPQCVPLVVERIRSLR